MKCADDLLNMPTNLADSPDKKGRLPRVAGAEDARLVNMARKLAPLRLSPQAKAVSECDRWAKGQMESLATPDREMAARRSKQCVSARDLEALQTSGFGVRYSNDSRAAGPATSRRSGSWTKTASALAPVFATLLFGTALSVALYGPKGGANGARSAITRPALVKVVSSEDRSTDLKVGTSSVATPTSEPSPTGVPAPTSVEPSATAAAVAAPQSAAWPSEEISSMRMAPAPSDAAAPASATSAGEAAPSDDPWRPAEAHRPPRGHDKSARLSRSSPASATVTETVAAAPSARTGLRRTAQHPAVPAIPLGTAGSQAIAAATAAPQPDKPMTHALGARTGVLWTSVVDQAARKSGDWAIQFASPKSEAEAEVAAARLNAKYAPTLNGATIGIRKTQVNGETTYALAVAGLSKADAAALCVRVKGRDCSVIK